MRFFYELFSKSEFHIFEPVLFGLIEHSILSFYLFRQKGIVYQLINQRIFGCKSRQLFISFIRSQV